MEEIFSRINGAITTAELEEIRIEVMGKKGILTARFAELKNCDELILDTIKKTKKGLLD